MRWLVFVLCACSSRQPAPQIPVDDLYYPVGVAAHPGGRYAYVVNANTDLYYASGSLVTVDLDALAPLGQDERFNRGAFSAGGMRRIGAFGGFPLLDGNRLFVPDRAQSVIHSLPLSADGASLACDDAVAGECGSVGTPSGEHAEPFSLAFASTPEAPGRTLVANNLGGGTITAFNVSAAGELSEYGHLDLGVDGTRSVAVVPGPSGQSFVFMSPRVALSRATTLAYFFDPRALTTGAPSGAQGSLSAGVSGVGEISTVVASPDNKRLYVLIDDPNSIAVVDTSLNPADVPTSSIITTIDLPGPPGAAAYLSRATGDLLYVSDKDSNTIWAVDLNNGLVVAELSTGLSIDGSAGGLAIAHNSAGDRLLATYFTGDALVVYDISDKSPSAHFALARVGSPRNSK